jgi:hypothetical protein
MSERLDVANWPAGAARADGYSVVPTTAGWSWAAYGPRGSEFGSANSEAAAGAAAREAHERLRRPR